MRTKNVCFALLSALMLSSLALSQAKADTTAVATVTAPTAGSSYTYTYMVSPPYITYPTVTGTSTHSASFTNNGADAVTVDIDITYELAHASKDGGMMYKEVVFKFGGELQVRVPAGATWDRDGLITNTLSNSFEASTWQTYAETLLDVDNQKQTASNTVTWNVTL